jgi:hypothetical protein
MVAADFQAKRQPTTNEPRTYFFMDPKKANSTAGSGTTAPAVLIPADAPPMPGGAAAVARPKVFATKFTVDGDSRVVRQTAEQQTTQVASALANLHQVANNVRSVLANLSEEQRKLWEEMQGVVSMGDLRAVADDFDALVKRWEQ